MLKLKGESFLSGRSWWQLIFLVIFIFISALVSYVRGYLEAQNEKKIERDADDGNKKAKKLKKLIGEDRQNISDALWVTQMTLVILEAGLIGFAFLSPIANAFVRLTGWETLPCLFLSAVLCVFVYACLYLVIVRRVCAGIGTRSARKGEYGASFWAGLLYRVSLPMASVIKVLTKAFFFLCRIDTEVLDEDVTEDEILSMVESGEESGNIESEQKEMIENIFDFSTATAAELMTNRTDITAIEVNSSQEEILAVIKESGYSRIPVYEEDLDTIVGILSVRSYLLSQREDPGVSLRDICFPPYFAPSFIHADKLLADLKLNKIHMAIILDEYGGTAGLVTMEDLLEEIVGNIYDETDDPETEESFIEKLDENLYRMPGTLEVSLVEKELEIALPEDKSYDTVGGMVYSALTVIPDDGSTPAVDVDGLHIEVEKIEERRIEWVKVSIIPKNEEDENE